MCVFDGGFVNEYGDLVIVDVGCVFGVEFVVDFVWLIGIVVVNDLFVFGLMVGLCDGGLWVLDDVFVIGMDGYFLLVILWLVLIMV